MDGIGRALGAPAWVHLAGQDYFLRPLDLAGIASCENHILVSRSSPVDDLTAALERETNPSPIAVEIWNGLIQRAFQLIRTDKSYRVVAAEDLHNWLSTPDGLAYSGWYCLGRGRSRARAFASPTRARARLCADAKLSSAFKRARDIVSGTDVLANLDWPERMKHPRTGKVIEQPHSKYINWRQLIADLVSAVHWGPREIGRLTLYVLHILQHVDPSSSSDRASGEVQTSGGVASVSPQVAQQLAKMTPAQRREFLKTQGA